MGVGGGRKWEKGGRGAMLPFTPSCRRGVGAGAAAILAGLQPLQGTWSLGLLFKVFLFIHNNPKGGRKRERKALPGGGMNHVQEESLCGKPHLPLRPAPLQLNRIPDTDPFDSSDADVIWTYGRKHFERV